MDDKYEQSASPYDTGYGGSRRREEATAHNYSNRPEEGREDAPAGLRETDTGNRNTMRPVMPNKRRREDAPAALQETDTGSENPMRPVMSYKRRREDAPVALNMNEGEGRSQKKGRNVAAKEIKKRCPFPFCAVL